MKRVAEHGGDFQKGKRKTKRPFAKKKPMHVTLRRSNNYSNVSLLRKQRGIEKTIYDLAKKHQVHLYELAVNSNHIHLLLRGYYLRNFQNFLRDVSIKIVRLMTGTRKGRKLESSFWAARPWSRIVEWGRAFVAAKDYVFRNRLEASGMIPYDRTLKTCKLVESVRC